MIVIVAKSKYNPNYIRRFTADVWPRYESTYIKIKEEEMTTATKTGFNPTVSKSGCNCSNKSK